MHDILKKRFVPQQTCSKKMNMYIQNIQGVHGKYFITLYYTALWNNRFWLDNSSIVLVCFSLMMRTGITDHRQKQVH